MESCLFCNQVWSEDNLLYSDNTVAVYLDMDPISKGHILIFPKSHYVDVDEIPSDILADIMSFAQKYVRLIKDVFHISGYSMMQNGGVYNDINHFHLHVFPRYSKEQFGWTYSDDEDSEASDFKKLQEKLRPLLAAV